MSIDDSIWFTGDTHFGHGRIIQYCERPFSDVDDMNQMLIANWNQYVGQNHTVYHLGDLGFLNYDKLVEIIDKLNGRIHMIAGNHDNRKVLRKLAKNNKIAWVKRYYMLKIQDDEIGVKQNIALFHWPIERWDKSHYGSWHLHGHCHGTLISADTQARLDVGVDAHNFRPISYGEVKLHMTRKVFKPIKRN